MDEIKIAWLAGLMEGEGSFIAATEKYPACIAICMTDLDIIEVVAAMWGTSICRPKRQKDHHKQSYRCMSRGSKAIQWMKVMRPYLGKRRKQQVDAAVSSHKLKGPFQKVTDDEAAQILQRFRSGERAADLGREFKITKWAVYAIHQGRRKCFS